MSDHKKLTSLRRHSLGDRTYKSNNIFEFKAPRIPTRRIKIITRKLEFNHHTYKSVATTTKQKTIHATSSKSLNKRKRYTVTRIHSKELILTPAAAMIFEIRSKGSREINEIYWHDRYAKRRKLEASQFDIQPYSEKELGNYLGVIRSDQNENSLTMKWPVNNCSNNEHKLRSTEPEPAEVVNYMDDCKTPEPKRKLQAMLGMQLSLELIQKFQDEKLLGPTHSSDVKPAVVIKTENESDNNNSNWSYRGSSLDIHPGQLLWVLWSRSYWPAIVDQLQSTPVDSVATPVNDKIYVKFFASRGQSAEVAKKDVWQFDGLDSYNSELKQNEGNKRFKNTSQAWVKAVAEATYALSIDVDIRLAYFDIIVICTLPNIFEKSANSSWENIISKHSAESQSEAVKKLFQENPNIFDEVNKELAKYLTNMGVIFPTTQKSQTPAPKKTTANKQPHHSTPLPGRRSIRLSSTVQSKLSVSQLSASQDEAPSRSVEIVTDKKSRNSKKNKEEKRKEFEADLKNYTATARKKDILFKGLQDGNVCKECLTVDAENNRDPVKCSGACGDYVHEKCAPTTDVPNTLLCHECIDSPFQVCYACKQKSTEPVVLCSVKTCRRNYHMTCLNAWPQTRNFDHLDKLTCPLHVCHHCVSDDPKNKDSTCISAGVKMLTKSQHICIGHREKKYKAVSLNWCYICGGAVVSTGGNFLCCESCPQTVHMSCLRITVEPEHYFCEGCESGRHPLYGEIVWAKYGTSPWWTAIIVPPTCIPDCVLNKHHNDHDLCVRFFATYDFGWVGRTLVYLYHEGDEERSITGKSTKATSSARGKLLENAIREAEILNKELMADAKKTRPPEPLKYHKIIKIQLVGLAKMNKDKDKSTPKCSCNPDIDPCGPSLTCTNRSNSIECDPATCPCGDKCDNQSIGKRKYASCEVKYMGDKGFGLIAKTSIVAETIVSEYVGELVTKEEYQSRLSKKQTQNYYFMKYGKCYIDAERKGNLSRFINHSCNPNCEPRKIIVKGEVRIGLVALKDIEKGTELTFNYEFDDKKHICFCGEDSCRGVIGGKAVTKK